MRKLTFVFFILTALLTIAQEEPLVSNIFQDTYILDALADISAQTGVPIIADTTVTGFITMELNEVPLEQALKMILMPGGYVYRKMDGFYFVGSPDPANPAFRYLVETKTYKLKYITTVDAEELLPPLYRNYVKFNEKNNMITITAPEEIIQEFEKDLEKIDIPIPQVKISVIVTEVSKDYSNELGLNSLDYSFGSGQEFNENWSATLGLVTGLINVQTDVFGQILAQLKLLEEDQKAKITADPWIIVKSGEKASLFLGERQVVLLQAEGAVSRIESIDVGVSIDIQPRVMDKEELELTLSPKVSHFAGEKLGTFAVKQNELSTTLFLKNGQTVVISGATIEDNAQTNSGVPILNKIPLIRYLFGGTMKKDSQKELYIFIKAEIQGSE
ncbi:type II secretion system protein GspD [Thermotoga sp. RQ2]|uniref:type II secretion system protein GspD n=1 Tax=Thermotoga sp. (strain RQ2) TaxID=126740 RepID=UPI0001600B8F|nr:secretin N-terminal domain-containing protein [Thermotoga sp. RQ2]ACB10033.1 type II and III secretion system protein [Thermotoga sp. RQ2]